MMNRDDAAVSEVIGFIIIFGLVVTAIALIMYTAVPAMDDAQEREHVANAERAFSILQDNIEDVVLRTAPARGTHVSLHDSELEIAGQAGYVNVSVQTPDGVEYQHRSFGSVSYRTGTGDDVVYENGAVFRFDGIDRSGMVYEPNWRVTEEEVFISSVRTRTRGGGMQRTSGEHTTLLRAERLGDGTDRHVYDDVTSFNVTVHSPRADGWQVYMEGLGEVDSDNVVRHDEETVSMEVDTGLQRVIHLENRVALDLEG